MVNSINLRHYGKPFKKSLVAYFLPYLRLYGHFCGKKKTNLFLNSKENTKMLIFYFYVLCRAFYCIKKKLDFLFL